LIIFSIIRRGINDQIKLHAQNLADRTGAVAVVPDLYKGKIGVTAEASVKHIFVEVNI
jgi:hypothetical protein